ncbi:hypothetical protein IMCC26134_12855 [Verrucomicrobia bacterium IMCC26134]|nr:hypothetical protein IMCC26134_12855 [Verrucomicrobia bacterium IMCC26134]
MRSTVLSVFIFSVLQLFALAQTPPASPVRNFKGVAFGTSATVFAKAYKPSGEWGNNRLPPEAYYDPGDAAIRLTPPIPPLTKQQREATLNTTYPTRLSDAIGGISCEVTFIFAVQSPTDVKILTKGMNREAASRALFREVRGKFQRGEFAQMLQGVTTKYGEPTVADTEFGRFEWRVESLHILLRYRDRDSPSYSSISIIDTLVPSLAGKVAASDM